jgi:hypothetical protein
VHREPRSTMQENAGLLNLERHKKSEITPTLCILAQTVSIASASARRSECTSRRDQRALNEGESSAFVWFQFLTRCGARLSLCGLEVYLAVSVALKVSSVL